MQINRTTNTNHDKQQSWQRGFTIIELMIATAVLSTILVMTTVVMVNIGSLYYKGINQSRVQDDTRTIADEIIKNIQLNDQPPTDIVNAPNGTTLVCIGAVRYAYVLGVQIGNKAPGTGTLYHQVLWRDDNPTPGSCPVEVDTHDSTKGNVDLTRSDLATADPSGTELITSNSRLTTFCFGTTDASGQCTQDRSSPQTIKVGVAYGDNDLLCNPTRANNSCNTPSAMIHWTDYSGDVLCKGGKGDQFCSTAHITGSAVKRVAGGSF